MAADVTEDEEAALLASASVVLYPSPAESFRVVFLESLVVRRTGGRMSGTVLDVVEGGVTGLPPHRRFRRAGKYRFTVDRNPTEARRLGAEGQRRVREGHTWAAVARRARQELLAGYEAVATRKAAL